MNNAELYRTANSLQKRDAVECLEEYAKNMKWKKCGDRIIDIGCADGSVTNILKSYLPDNYKKLVGCDVSEKMVRYANEHHGFGRTSFRVLNIEGDLPEDLREDFDHVFSFYTLHWIINQEKAFKNIYDILADGGDCLLLFVGDTPIFDVYTSHCWAWASSTTESVKVLISHAGLVRVGGLHRKAFKNIYDILADGGDCLLLFVGDTPIFDVYRKLAQSNKWSSWLKDVDRFISPYHDSTDPEKEVKKLMDKIGFTDIKVQCRNMVYVFDDVKQLKKSVTAINPFKIPENLLEDFMDDYMQVIWDMRLLDKANNNVTEIITVTHNYRVIVASGRKHTQSNLIL